MSSSVLPAPIPRSLHLALFVTGVLWLLAAHAVAFRAAEGIAGRLGLSAVAQDLLINLFLLFLLLVGFTVLNWIGTRQGSVRLANALPKRATTREEWSRGAVIGWAAALAAIVPMVIGSNEKTLQAAERLQREGFAVRAIRPPTVPAGKARLRFSLTTKITAEELSRLVKARPRLIGILKTWKYPDEISVHNAAP